MSALSTTELCDQQSVVTVQTTEGLELQATLVSITRFQATFEVSCPPGVLRLSEALKQLRIVVHDRPLFTGRAVVTNLIHLGSNVVCEAALDEAGLDLTGSSPTEDLQQRFSTFLNDCGTNFRIEPQFKVVMADMRTFFLDLRLWMEQMELFVRSAPVGDRHQLEREILQTLEKPVLPAAQPLLEKFESLANDVERERQTFHRAYMKRQIHPVVMCSPFLYRTYQKPLGYAGDYEMVNMMLRDPFEGASMFAKLVNRIFLATPPVLAHQDRIAYLQTALAAEAMRAWGRKQPLRVFDLGCGPAKQVQHFIAESHLSDLAQFTLLDFNEETLAYTGRVLNDLKSHHRRRTSISTVKKSVHQILKEVSRSSSGTNYDFVLCAGLFDYLSDPACKRLLSVLYDLVAPGGLLLATNVNRSNPSRHWMEYVLDWHLIYRNADQFASLTPERAQRAQIQIQAIGTGVNLALQIRKPEHAS